jgi:alkyl hydroperoxide reductase subunit AhpC
MLSLILMALISSAQAYTFQAKNVVTQAPVTFPSAKAKATIVVFMSAKCPCSASHEKTLNDLATEYTKQGFEFVGVHSNQDETAKAAGDHFKASAFSFPVVQDEKAKIANELKALKTPHVFILQNNKIVFEGGVDDSADAAEAKKFFLKDALRELSEGKPVTLAKARALGCVIKR